VEREGDRNALRHEPHAVLSQNDACAREAEQVRNGGQHGSGSLGESDADIAPLPSNVKVLMGRG